MEIDIDNIRIPYNWVLIKPDENFKTTQRHGKDTGIHVPPWGINAASHISVTGTVIAVPEKLRYYGKKIKELRANLSEDSPQPPELPILRRQSMDYLTSIEITAGDKVYYEYTTRLDASKEGRIIDTKYGELMLVPYYILIMAFVPGCDMSNVKPTDVRMLNGNILIKPLEYALETNLQGVQGTRTEMDIFVPVTKQELKYVKFNNTQFANVIACGSLVKDYCDYPKAPADDPRIGKPGQKIAYDGRMQKRLEVEYHHVIFGEHILYRIHRKDILMWYVNGRVNFFK